MFRPMLRHAQQLSFEECEQILIEAKRGVLSVQGDGGYPYGIPMNHLYLDGKLDFHERMMEYEFMESFLKDEDNEDDDDDLELEDDLDDDLDDDEFDEDEDDEEDEDDFF